jgi:lactoylglutathione lyase
VRTLHLGLWGADVDRLLASCTAVGYEVVGEVPGTGLGHLPTLKLPGHEFVSIELVHDPDEPPPGGDRLSHLVIQVEPMDAALAGMAPAASTRRSRPHPTGQQTSGRRRSSTRTANQIELAGSSGSVGLSPDPGAPLCAPRARPSCGRRRRTGGHVRCWSRPRPPGRARRSPRRSPAHACPAWSGCRREISARTGCRRSSTARTAPAGPATPSRSWP